MTEKTIAYGGTAFLALVLAYFKALVVPLAILVILMVTDYITGITAAWMKNELSSKVGIKGIVKKLLYMALVVVACAIDIAIANVAGKAGIDIAGMYCVGLMVIMFLIFNESISILENVSRAGGPEIPFLSKLIKHLKQTAEKKAEEAIPEESEKNTPGGPYFSEGDGNDAD